MCVQGVGNVSFLENFGNAINESSPIVKFPGITNEINLNNIFQSQIVSLCHCYVIFFCLTKIITAVTNCNLIAAFGR